MNRSALNTSERKLAVEISSIARIALVVANLPPPSVSCLDVSLAAIDPMDALTVAFATCFGYPTPALGQGISAALPFGSVSIMARDFSRSLVSRSSKMAATS